MFAPVVLFVYNRSEQLNVVLESLEKNREVNRTDLYIFSDGPKRSADEFKVQMVRKVIDEYRERSQFKSVMIHKAESNKGLAKSIIEGVSKVIEKYGKIIVLEDDLVVSDDFLKYMNDALDFYEKESRVGAISAFALPIKHIESPNTIYKSRTGNSCGWATWENVWKGVEWDLTQFADFRIDKKSQRKFNSIQYGISDMLLAQMDGKIDSWAVRWDFHFFINHLYTVYPFKSKIQNIGFGDAGTHSKDENDFRSIVIAENQEIILEEFDNLKDFTRFTAMCFKPSLKDKLWDFLKRRKCN